MAKSTGSKVYAVARGRAPGIYSSWGDCQAQTSGFKGAIFKSFKTQSEAQSFMQSNGSSSKSISAAPSSTASGSSTTSGSKQDRKRSRRDDGALATQRKKQQPSSSGGNCRVQITIHFDGGSRGNPGLAGAGAAVVLADHAPPTGTARETTPTTYSVREYCGAQHTNNHAEYRGLRAGLQQAKLCLERYLASTPQKTAVASGTPLFQLQIYGDSKLIIQQLRGVYRCGHPNIRPLFLQCEQLIGDMQRMCAKSEVLYDHVYREQNKIADALANEAMDQCRSWTTSTLDGSLGDESRKSAVAPRDNKKSEATAVRARERMKSAVAAARDKKRSAAATATEEKDHPAIPDAPEREVIDADDDSDVDSYLSC